MSCQCNPPWWGNTVCCVCGEFPTPVNPDKGICTPHRVKIDCEAPEILYLYEMSYDPDVSPPFIVL